MFTIFITFTVSRLAADRNSLAGWVVERRRRIVSARRSVCLVVVLAHSEFSVRAPGLARKILQLAGDCPCHMYVE